MEPTILSEARKANEITICEFYNSFVPPQYGKRLVWDCWRQSLRSWHGKIISRAL